jgi:hypothetical protein
MFYFMGGEIAKELRGMKFGKKRLYIAFPLLIGAAMAAGCKFLPALASTPPLEQLSVSSSEISNWQPQGDMTVYIGGQLYNFNDGGAPQYLNKGCIKTGVQVINGPSGEGAQNVIMDFGTDEAAAAMYQFKLSDISAPLTDPKYADSTVTIQTAQDGITGYAHFYNYYFEIGLTKFNNPQDAIKTLNQFLGLYEGKLES